MARAVSPEEWASEIKLLIEHAEDDGMRFFVYGGDFMISGHPWSIDDRNDGVLIW